MEENFSKPSFTIRFVSVLMAILLVVTLIPKNISFAYEQKNGESLDERIEKMVSLPHVEGQVIVGFKSGISQDELQAQTDSSFEQYEKIISVDAGENTLSNSDFSPQSDKDQIDIAVITSSDRTTSQLLKDLLQDKDVVFAEPNYLIDKSDTTSPRSLTSGQAKTRDTQAQKIATTRDVQKSETMKSALTAQKKAINTSDESEQDSEDTISNNVAQEVKSLSFKEESNKGSYYDQKNISQNNTTVMSEDQEGILSKLTIAVEAQAKKNVAHEKVLNLNPYQWGMTSNASTRSSVIKQGKPASSNIPNFDTQISNMDRKVKVAVIDTGVDYTHPDLIGKVYRFSKEEQEMFGCGEWGFCARPNAPQDEAHIAPGNHGTHCAGVIGAAWDGHGISGVASDAIIVNIVNSTPDGLKMETDSILRSLAFVDVFNDHCASPEEKILVTSNSYGGKDSSISLNTLIYSIGKKHGTISIFAAGNDYINNDSTSLVCNGLSYNPYKVVVAASDQSGNLSMFSNWGKTLVDIAAPGVSILSSVPASKSLNYYPDAVSNNVFYEGFEKDTSSVVIEGCSLENADVVQLESAITSSNTVQAAGSHSLCTKLDPRMFGYQKDPSETDNVQQGFASFYLRLQLSDAQVKQLVSMENPTLGLAFDAKSYSPSFFCSGLSDGEIVELKSTIASSSTGGWSYAQVDLRGVDITNANTIALKIATTLAPDAREIYFDSIGIGNEFIPYETYDGTSMSCPLVAGGAAVLVAKYPNESGEARAARVIASVSKHSSLKELIASGGVFDLNEEKAGIPVKVPPTKLGAKVYENNLGYYNKKTTNEEELFELRSYLVDGQMLQFDNTILKAADTGLLGDESNKNEYRATLKYRWFDLESREWIDNATIELPEYLSETTACIYEDQLFILGNRLGKDDLGNPEYVRDAAVLYIFNLKTREWSVVENIKGVVTAHRKHLIASEDGIVLVDFGNTLGDDGHTAFYHFDDITALESDSYAVIDYGFSEANIGIKDNVIYFYDLTHSETMYLVSPEKVDLIEKVVLPDPFAFYDRSKIVHPYNDSSVEPGKESEQKTLAELDVSPLLIGHDGIYIVGYDTDKEDADTWILPHGSLKFEPYAKRLSLSPVVGATATMKDGEIFAMGYASLEPEKIIFRSTQAEDPAAPEIPKSDVMDSANNMTAKEDSDNQALSSYSSTPKTGDLLMIASIAVLLSLIALGIFVARKRMTNR